MIGALQFILIMGQLFYWLVLRDEDREQVIWNACLYPGRDNA